MQNSDRTEPLTSGAAQTESIVRGSPIVDLLFIAGVLAAGNWFLFPADLGWRLLNPTPYLLIPILLGGRYGIAWGLAAGLATGGSLLALHCLPAIDVAHLTMVFLAAPHFYLSLPVTGALAGLLNRYLRHKNRRLAAENADLHRKREVQDTNLEAALESSHILREELARNHTELASLDRELRRIAAPAAGALFENALEVIADLYGVYEAAVYRVDGDAGLRRSAFLGGEGAFPEMLQKKSCPLVRAALKARRMATPREVWNETPERGSNDYLVAIPWVDGDSPPLAVLVLRSLPFLNLTWRNLAGIELICRWAARFVGLRGGEEGPDALPDPIVSHPEFKRSLALAVDTLDRFQLPSAIAVITGNGESPPLTREAIEERVRPLLQGAEVATRLPGDLPGLAVLLPMEGRIDGDDFAERFAASIKSAAPADGEAPPPVPRVTRLLVAEKRGVDEVWKEIEEHGKP